MPIDDPKNELCDSFNVLEITHHDEYIGLFRIIPQKTSIQDNIINYECEHVLATLLGDVLFKYHQFTNYTTRQVLQFILDEQTTKHWVLDRVDFERRFHYKFENENGLLAPVLSIPEPFNEPYRFEYNTQTYPWELSLVRPSEVVKGELRWGKNMGSFDEVLDPTEIVNRIYPLGAGEGVNQLDITEVNNSVPYIEDAESIKKYGLFQYVWVDNRFENAKTLMANGESLLSQWKDPKISLEAKASDLSMKEEFKHERLREGDLVEIIVPDRDSYIVRIVNESKGDLFGRYEDIDFELNNKLDDIATTQADVERKQQVNDAYSMGATNIMNFTYQDNCDSAVPALIPIYIDDDVVNINTCELTFRTKAFRAYSQATHGGGAIVESTSSGGSVVKSTSSGGGTTRSTTSGGGTTATSSSGGGTTATSSSGGGTSKSTNSGGSTTQSSTSAGTHRHRVFNYNNNFGTVPADDNWQYYSAPRVADGTAIGAVFIPGAAGDIYTHSADGAHNHSVSIPAHSHSFSTPNHSHDVSISNHTHQVTIPNHAHDVTIPDHTHEIDIPNHSHEIELPNHTHDINHGIYELNETPSNVEIRVDGNVVDFDSTSGDRIDIVDYLEKDDSGKVTRGRHEIEISPNDLARIEADVILRVFIQSHLGGNY